MKILSYILFFVLLTVCGFSQKHTPNPSQEGNYASKKYYLVDSLDLTRLSNDDRQLIDSCLKVYHNTTIDTNKLKAIEFIVESSWDENVWPKYNQFAYQFLQNLLKIKHPKAISDKLKVSLASSLNNMGLFYFNQGNIPKALESYHKSLKIQEQLGDLFGMATSYNNIGVIYDNQKDTSLALNYYFKSLASYKAVDDKNGMATSYNNIGVIYDKQLNFQKALENYQKSLAILEELGNKKGVATTLNNIGTLYEDVKEVSRALEYYYKSLQLREEIEDKYGISVSFKNIGNLLFLNGKIDEAKTAGEKALRIAQQIGFPDLIKENARLLSEIAEKQGKNNDALAFYKLYITMRDSISNEETKKVSAQQQAKYEYEKQKAIDDTQYEKQLGIEKEAKAKQKVITYATAGGLGLVVVFLIFVFNRLQVTKRQKRVIEQQKLEVETQKEIVEKAHTLLEEKNNEILASIRYAKRIQDALLTSQKYIERNINRLKSSI